MTTALWDEEKAETDDAARVRRIIAEPVWDRQFLASFAPLPLQLFPKLHTVVVRQRCSRSGCAHSCGMA
ncbi:MAG: hypothetical protein Q4D38_01760 [Planctomycetia bacterium]|nr:hypothetical protein [Planctomycetia bacterium]